MADESKVNLPTTVTLSECCTDSGVTASFVGLHRELAKDGVDNGWWHISGVSTQELEEEVDFHWDWTELISRWQNKPFAKAVAVVTPDGLVQGAMIYLVNGKSVLEEEKRAVVIDRLAVAPRNREWLAEHPRYRGAGTGLLAYAICQSYSLGFEGRVNLFAAGREDFYQDRGFLRTEVVSDEMSLFELPSAVALAALRQKGMLP
jgi:GNAT superfamily N-acetyltransferase